MSAKCFATLDSLEEGKLGIMLPQLSHFADEKTGSDRWTYTDSVNLTALILGSVPPRWGPALDS